MTRPALIGDIGGTNARFALVTPGEHAPRESIALPCADYPGVVEAVRDYLARVGLAADDTPRQACLAFACPIDGDRVVMTNNHWSFSRREAQTALGLERLKVINDFTAQALGVPHLAPEELVEVQPGVAREHATCLV
ncbi:MAG: glucokinase, partial [Billgrantia desiderata]